VLSSPACLTIAARSTRVGESRSRPCKPRHPNPQAIKHDRRFTEIDVFPKVQSGGALAYPTGFSEPRHLQWTFSRRSCAAFLCLYFGLQALLFVKRTSSSSWLVGAAGLVPKGNAVAELTRRVTAEKITLERSICGFSSKTGDALGRSRGPNQTIFVENADNENNRQPVLCRLQSRLTPRKQTCQATHSRPVRAEWQHPNGAKSNAFATLRHFTPALSHKVRYTISVEQLRISFDLWLAKEVIPHGLLVRIPVPVILISLLLDAPNLVEQDRIGNGELEAGAHHRVGPL
jgi:hypothetical protein